MANTSQINDCILEATGGPTVNDGLLSYYLLNGATSNNIKDAEYEFLLVQGATASTSIQDMWFEFLRGRAYVGSVSDMQSRFWCVDGGVLTLDISSFKAQMFNKTMGEK